MNTTKMFNILGVMFIFLISFVIVQSAANGGSGGENIYGDGDSEITCHSDNDCPSETRRYCSEDGHACIDTTFYTCENPGTAEARCAFVVGEESCSTRICQYGCEEGYCLEEPTELECDNIYSKSDKFSINDVIFEYKSSDKISDPNPVVKLWMENPDGRELLEYSVPNGEFTIKVFGNEYHFVSASSTEEDDWDIQYICVDESIEGGGGAGGGSSSSSSSGGSGQRMSSANGAKIKMFVMSFCHFSKQAETAMSSALSTLYNYFFEPHYVIYSNYGRRVVGDVVSENEEENTYYWLPWEDYCLTEERNYCAMHGIKELHENIRQLCIWKYEDESTWWNYVERVNEECSLENINTCWENIAAEVGINIEQINECKENEAIELLENEMNLLQDYNVRGSPTVFIHEELYTSERTAEGYKEAILAEPIDDSLGGYVCPRYSEGIVVHKKELVKQSAIPDNTYENGWKFSFFITVPEDEDQITLKLDDWQNGESNYILETNGNVVVEYNGNYYSVGNEYEESEPFIATDEYPNCPGRQVSFNILVKLPQDTDYGYYTTDYGIRSLPREEHEPTICWEKVLGSPNTWNEATSIKQTTDGGYILTGTTKQIQENVAPNSTQDAWIKKIDSYGNLEWEKTFGYSHADWLDSVQQTSDGGYIAAGRTGLAEGGSTNAWILKLDLEGNLEWEKTFGDEDNWDGTRSIQQTVNGGYIAAGFTVSRSSGGSTDFWILKLDEEGNLEWDQSFGGVHSDEANSIQQTSDNGYIVAGYTRSEELKGSERDDKDILILKLDVNGNYEWESVFGGDYDDEANSVQQTKEGRYIIAGYKSESIENKDIWILYLNSEGNLKWDYQHGEDHDDEAKSVQVTSDDRFVVTGYINLENYGNSDAFILKFPSCEDHLGGCLEGMKVFGGDNTDKANSVQQTADGGYVLAGMIDGINAWVLKLDRYGNLCEIEEEIS